MHMDIDNIYYGDYKFTVEVDTGSETGANQLTVWVAEKAKVDSWPLSRFKWDQLFNALLEPQKSYLISLLDKEKSACRSPFEDEMQKLHQLFTTTTKKGKKKLPGKVERQISDLRKQMQKAMQQIEAEFAQRELLTLERQCFDWDVLQNESRVFEESRHLRNFYFEETNDRHIRNFCQKFATDEKYREEVIERETHWAKRNALFVRNLHALFFKDFWYLSDTYDFDNKARELFQWLDKHCEEILAIPEYQRIQEMDNTFQPCMDELDPFIQPAVEAFNRIPGVATRFSCQGISGQITFQGHDLLVVSEHEKYAYVSFCKLGQWAHDALVARLPDFPSITVSRTPGLELRSTGDNLRFREDMVILAQKLLDNVDESWNDLPEDSSLDGKFVVHSVPLPQDSSLPGGLLPSRLTWLCEQEQIERTLHLLFHLNHWAKARDQLLYDDRQGLYEVKALLLQQAYENSFISPITYIDGSQNFAHDYYIDLASDTATDVFIERLDMLFESETLSVSENEFDVATFKLFTRIMGYEITTRADIEAIDKQQVKKFIYESLQALVDRARSTRQPISGKEFAALLIYPMDLFEVYWSRNRPWPEWDDLDEGEARKLDPEGLSLIAFQYDSSKAHYIFHLPFRLAEGFLSEQIVQALRDRPSSSRECGVFYGRTISDEESLQYPIADILNELGVSIGAICPNKLISKEEYRNQSATYHSSYWKDDDEDWEEDDDEDWSTPARYS